MKYLIMTQRKNTFQNSALDSHYEFLEELRGQKKLILSGGFTDKSGGAYVIEAENLKAAETIALSDPIYKTNSSDIKIYEWNA